MWVALVLLLLLINIRSFPFMFHLTFLKDIILYNVFRKAYFCDLFSGCTKTYYVWPDDVDFNIHMNNSVYYKNADFGRIHLLLRSRFYHFLADRGYRVHNGGVYFSFKKELKPFQKYELKTQVHSWDEKWIYFKQTFLVGSTIHAVGFAKFVAKKGRLTIKPQEIFDQWKEKYQVELPQNAPVGPSVLIVEENLLKE